MVRQSVSNQAKLGQQKQAEEILELPVERQQGQSRHVNDMTIFLKQIGSIITGFIMTEYFQTRLQCSELAETDTDKNVTLQRLLDSIKMSFIT